MLPSSVRRVVASTAPGLACLASTAGQAVAPTSTCKSVVFRGHQRRCSSSKPSRSDSDSNEIAAGQSVPTSAASARGEGKANGEKRKRKNKDASSTAFKKLPSVPNTHHMSEEALGLSSFFSLHRPISITQTMPRSVTDEHFASIFTPKTKSIKVSETISTLSDTIDQLEGPMAQVTIGGSREDHGEHQGMHRVEMKNPDGTESSIYLQVDTMSGNFLPFRPPPSPQPQTTGNSELISSEAETSEEQPLHRVYKAMFTIEESTEPDGQIRIMAHSPRIMQDEQPRSFLERLAQRQLRLDETRGRRDMLAISVKRQRKLKMKKKKYKKLMKRTRNLRRKLDRT